MRESAPSPVESIDRALRLLTLLQSGQALSVTDAAAELDVVPSTSSRILAALAHRDFALQGPDRRYRVGPAMLGHDAELVTVSMLRAAATQALSNLHRSHGETVQLMVLQGAYIKFIDGIESEAPLRVGVRNGDRMPAHCSAGGKALLASLPNTDVEAIYRSGFPTWPTARLTDIASLKRQLTTVRRRGYGLNHEETEQGVSGAGVAVLDVVGRPVAAITTAVPSTRFAQHDLAQITSALMQAKHEVETQLAAAT